MRVLFLCVLCGLLCLSQISSAFTTAHMVTDYRSIAINFALPKAFEYIRLQTDFGLTRTLGFESGITYQSQQGLFWDGVFKFRANESRATPLAIRVGFLTNLFTSLDFTLGFQLEHYFTSFFQGQLGLNIALGDKVQWSYFLAGDYFITHDTSLLFGLRKDYWDNSLGSFVIGLKALF